MSDDTEKLYELAVEHLRKWGGNTIDAPMMLVAFAETVLRLWNRSEQVNGTHSPDDEKRYTGL